MSDEEILAGIREAHLRAWLSGIEQLTPLEIRAVVRAAIDARNKVLERAYEVLEKFNEAERSIRHDNVMFEIENIQRTSRRE
jgi:hypothetical protein